LKQTVSAVLVAHLVSRFLVSKNSGNEASQDSFTNESNPIFKEYGESMNIYVGNLPFKITQDELRDLFSPFGAVDRVNVVTDRETGRARGFGFVEMANDDESRAAIEGLNGQEVDGRALTVNEAKPREPRR
jgi:RNA recognition motif-containing protein